MSTTTLTPRIYIACLTAYNNGKLHGGWIDATQTVDDIYTAISAMLAASPEPNAEEWALHDYEGFGAVRLSEWEGIERVARLATFIDTHEALGAEVLAHFSGDIEAAEQALIDHYIGNYESLAEYAQELTEETTKIPAHLVYYIDYAAMARDLELNGDLFTIGLDGRVHIFWNH